MLLAEEPASKAPGGTLWGTFRDGEGLSCGEAVGWEVFEIKLENVS